jgi:hypothetical protein
MTATVRTDAKSMFALWYDRGLAQLATSRAARTVAAVFREGLMSISRLGQSFRVQRLMSKVVSNARVTKSKTGESFFTYVYAERSETSRLMFQRSAGMNVSVVSIEKVSSVFEYANDSWRSPRKGK